MQGIDGRGADFTDVHLELAKLGHADLHGAMLTGATLDSSGTVGTCHEETTVWPARYTPATTESLDACGPENWKPTERDKT
ncbi:pentapeptide repeat-containing protein [Arthrobacter sp. 754]|uniref:pentapeptide repeat-containing protein n=1 Tax=Arthrobacter sp. 754 TaxID=3156315 RepID=UPI00339142B6